jgi:hypothetical protein
MKPPLPANAYFLKSMRQFLFLAIALLPILYPISLGASDEECTRTSKMRIYSDAFIAEESGDLDGYELALGELKGSTVDALLFVYEGSAAEGIRLPGHISGKKLSIEGTWVEHLIEYPSKKETVQTHLVKMDGNLGSRSFRGTIKIGDMVASQTVRLKLVNHIWVCKK